MSTTPPRLKPIHMIYFRGLFPSNTIGKSVYSHQGLTYGGILVKSDMKFTQYLELFENILNYYFEKSFEKLFIKQIPSIL